MLKKVLLTIAVIIFAVSCSSPSNPDKENTGIDSTYVGTWKGTIPGPDPIEYVAIVNSDDSINLRNQNIPNSQITKNANVYTIQYSLVNEDNQKIDITATITFNSDGKTANLEEVHKINGIVVTPEPLKITITKQ